MWSSVYRTSFESALKTRPMCGLRSQPRQSWSAFKVCAAMKARLRYWALRRARCWAMCLHAQEHRQVIGRDVEVLDLAPMLASSSAVVITQFEPGPPKRIFRDSNPDLRCVTITLNTREHLLTRLRVLPAATVPIQPAWLHVIGPISGAYASITSLRTAVPATKPKSSAAIRLNPVQRVALPLGSSRL